MVEIVLPILPALLGNHMGGARFIMQTVRHIHTYTTMLHECMHDAVQGEASEARALSQTQLIMRILVY